jgi:hypothetical protein
MTRYYAPTCYANAEEKVEGWHHSLRRALWCHAILNPTVHPLKAIYAKDTGEPRRPLNGRERDEITDIISASPWRLTRKEVQEVITRTEKPPWELGEG